MTILVEIRGRIKQPTGKWFLRRRIRETMIKNMVDARREGLVDNRFYLSQRHLKMIAQPSGGFRRNQFFTRNIGRRTCQFHDQRAGIAKSIGLIIRVLPIKRNGIRLTPKKLRFWNIRSRIDIQ